jgi:membrane protease subunit HflK
MSLNDPQWGKKGGGSNQGPPDLEELWRNFNQKLNAMFSKRGGGDGSSATPPSMRQIGGGVGMLIALVLVVWLASGFYTVDEKQRGVVFTFGKQTDLTSPGLRWRLPYPIQSNEIVNLSQVRTVEVGYRNTVKTKVLKESLMLTDDEKIIDIQFAVQYKLQEALPYQ